MKIKNAGVVLITGGAKRIGRAMALHLAEQGYDIAIHYKFSKKEAVDLKTEIRKKLGMAEIFYADLADPKQTRELSLQVKDYAENRGGWKLLINNASVFKRSKFLTEDGSEMLENFNLHLVSPLILSQGFAEVASGEGDHQIINMIDKKITDYQTSYFYYVLSKKFLAELTKMTSLALAPKVRVNAIAPGFILNNNDSEFDGAGLIKKIPLQSQGKMENITQALDFLIKNKFVTGQIIFVDGGASLNYAG